MTVKEYKAILEAMDKAAFEQFKDRYGGGGATREWYVDSFVANPKSEARLCHILGVPTEAERDAEQAALVAQATVSAAESARLANEHSEQSNQIARAANMIARKSNKIAWMAFGFSLVTFFITVLSLLFPKDTPPAANLIPSQARAGVK